MYNGRRGSHQDIISMEDFVKQSNHMLRYNWKTISLIHAQDITKVETFYINSLSKASYLQTRVKGGRGTVHCPS